MGPLGPHAASLTALRSAAGRRSNGWMRGWRGIARQKLPADCSCALLTLRCGVESPQSARSRRRSFSTQRRTSSTASCIRRRACLCARAAMCSGGRLRSNGPTTPRRPEAGGSRRRGAGAAGQPRTCHRSKGQGNGAQSGMGRSHHGTTARAMANVAPSRTTTRVAAELRSRSAASRSAAPSMLEQDTGKVLGLKECQAAYEADRSESCHTL